MTTNRSDPLKSTTATSFFPQNISAYFQKPSRIIKSSGRTQSPRNHGRRRMTTQLPTRTRSVHDTYRSDLTAQQTFYESAAPPRPTSWHPHLFDDYQQLQMQNQQFLAQPQQMSANTSFAYGLVTPTSYPVLGTSHLDCSIQPLDQLTGEDLSFTSSAVQPLLTYPHLYDSSYSACTPASAMDLGAYDVRFGSRVWPSLPQTLPPHIATAPVSPMFFPMPMPDLGYEHGVAEVQQGADKDELVGMGLYDSPAQVQSAGQLFSGSLPLRRKSLKLEESFEPAPQSGSDDDDAESEPIIEDAAPVESMQYYSAVDLTCISQKSVPEMELVSSYEPLQPEFTTLPIMPDYYGSGPLGNGSVYNWF